MPPPLILASSSEVRLRLLRTVGLVPEVVPARLDEDALRAALTVEGVPPRDQADALAEGKALKLSARRPEALVLGADQILDLDGEVLSKPADRDAALAQLSRLAGQTHRLHSAAVLAQEGRPIWRHVGTARLTMRPLSATFLAAYLDRNWDSVRHSVGGYKIEEEGARLFTQVDGDHFTVMGLPLLPLLDQLVRLRLLDS